VRATEPSCTGREQLPDDHRFNVEKLTHLFSIPTVAGKTITSGEADDTDYDDDEMGGAADEDGEDGEDGVGLFGGAGGFNRDYVSSSPTDDYECADGVGPMEVDDDIDDIPAGWDPSESGGDGAIAELGGASKPAPAGALKLIGNVRQVNKIHIGYAQKAKVMDVKKLKQRLWTEIEEQAVVVRGRSSPEPGADVEHSEADPAAAAGHEQGGAVIPAEAQTLKKLWADVPGKVDRKMADNLSVPIMFVCLLYLANDKELRIDSVPLMNDLIIQQKFVEDDGDGDVNADANANANANANADGIVA
jgi:condensin complex subunit 2